MPYIDQESRQVLAPGIQACTETVDTWTTGMLNYVITRICMQWLNFHGKGYKQLIEMIGTLECVKLEFYSRVVSPYEDEKMKDNGDVY